MSKQIVAQESAEVKLRDLINRADKIIAALAIDVDEDDPLGRAISQWLLDAEAATGDPALDGAWYGYPAEEVCR